MGPTYHLGTDLPVGLQFACAPGEDEKVLGIA